MAKHFKMELPSQCPEFVKAFIEADRKGSECLKMEFGTGKSL